MNVKYKNLVNLGTYLAYLLLVAHQIFYHKMWRDELQAWLISKESNSLRDFIANSRFEGRSPLYHFLISPISHMTDNPEWLKIFTFIMVIGISYLIIYKIDIDFFVKILILTGFLFTAGYSSISRDYIVIVFLSLILLTRYFSKQYSFLDTFLLSVLALINVFGLILSLFWIILHSSQIIKKSIGHAFLLFVTILTSAFFILPESENTFQLTKILTISQVPNEVILIIFDTLTFRASYFAETNWIYIPTILWTIIFITLIALSDKKLLLAFSVSSSLLIGVYLFTPGNFWWHKGMLTIVILITSLILYLKRQKNSLHLATKFVVCLFLLLQVAANFSSQVNGMFSKDYSNARETAYFLKQECNSRCDYIANAEYAATPISAYLGGQVFYAFDKQRFSNFTVWDAQVKEWDWTQAAEISKDMKNPIFILNQNISPPENFELVKAFEGAVWKDEDYFIFSLKE